MINRFCPICASEKVHMEEDFEILCFVDGKPIFAKEPHTYYECGECNYTWERHVFK